MYIYIYCVILHSFPKLQKGCRLSVKFPDLQNSYTKFVVRMWIVDLSHPTPTSGSWLWKRCFGSWQVWCVMAGMENGLESVVSFSTGNGPMVVFNGAKRSKECWESSESINSIVSSLFTDSTATVPWVIWIYLYYGEGPTIIMGSSHIFTMSANKESLSLICRNARLRLLLSQEKAKIRELGSDPNSKPVRDEILQWWYSISR